MRCLPSIREIKLLRLPALLVLVFAMLATPVLAAMGDLHGVGHDQQADVGMHGAQEHGGDDEHADGDLLHAFMHAAQCCSHLAAVFESISLIELHDLMPAARLPELLAPRSVPRSSLFRPPIAV